VGFEQRLLARARGAGLRRGDRLIVGFSGGCDSLALAAGLRRAQDADGIELRLVHVDHRLRRDSDRDARLAAELAGELGLAYVAVAVPESPAALHPGVGVEEAARRERYRLLAAAGEEFGARAIATGHHLQDQAETVVLHLLRGSGVHGAAAMQERSPLPLGEGQRRRSDISLEMSQAELASHGNADVPGREQLWLWRPLLRESRSDIAEYVRQLGLSWIEDASNADQDLRRNVVRHEIMPLLESRFPGASAALARYADLAAADDDMLESLAAAALESQVDPGGQLRVEALHGRPLGLQRRVVRRWLNEATGSREFSAERIDAVLELAISGRGNRTIEAGGGWRIGLVRGRLSARHGPDDDEGES
jgi:tRNA(Ile)-lysidine synthase